MASGTTRSAHALAIRAAVSGVSDVTCRSRRSPSPFSAFTIFLSWDAEGEPPSLSESCSRIGSLVARGMISFRFPWFGSTNLRIALENIHTYWGLGDISVTVALYLGGRSREKPKATTAAASVNPTTSHHLFAKACQYSFQSKVFSIYITSRILRPSTSCSVFHHWEHNFLRQGGYMHFGQRDGVVGQTETIRRHDFWPFPCV